MTERNPRYPNGFIDVFEDTKTWKATWDLIDAFITLPLLKFRKKAEINQLLCKYITTCLNKKSNNLVSRLSYCWSNALLPSFKLNDKATLLPHAVEFLFLENTSLDCPVNWSCKILDRDVWFDLFCKNILLSVFTFNAQTISSV